MQPHPTYVTPDRFRSDIADMAHHAGEMLVIIRHAFAQPPGAIPARVAELGKTIHSREKILTAQVAGQLHEAPWSLGPAQYLAFAPAALERIGDCAEALARAVETQHREDAPFSEQAITEVSRLFAECAALLEAIEQAVRAVDRTALARVSDGTRRVQTLCDQAARGHEERLITAVCLPRASSIFLSMLDSFREVARYAERLLPHLERALGEG